MAIKDDHYSALLFNLSFAELNWVKESTVNLITIVKLISRYNQSFLLKYERGKIDERIKSKHIIDYFVNNYLTLSQFYSHHKLIIINNNEVSGKTSTLDNNKLYK